MHQINHKAIVFVKKLYWIVMRITTIQFTVNNVPFFCCKFWKFIFRTVQQIYTLLRFCFYKMFTEFCKNSKVVSSDFSMRKNIVAPLLFSPCLPGLPIKLICSGFFNLLYLLRSIVINL